VILMKFPEGLSAGAGRFRNRRRPMNSTCPHIRAPERHRPQPWLLIPDDHADFGLSTLAQSIFLKGWYHQKGLPV